MKLFFMLRDLYPLIGEFLWTIVVPDAEKAASLIKKRIHQRNLQNTR